MDVLSVAKLRLTDEEKKHRQVAQRQLAIQRGRGQMTFGDALEIYRARLQANPDIKSKTKDYYEQRIVALLNQAWKTRICAISLSKNQGQKSPPLFVAQRTDTERAPEKLAFPSGSGHKGDGSGVGAISSSMQANWGNDGIRDRQRH
jgi:hypothetical protein